MSLLSILRYPDVRLHKVASPVTVFDEGLKRLVADMAETMYAAPGIGLAAIQVDIPKQVIVVDVSERRDSLVVLVNPEVLETTGVSDIEEGCLSVPGIYELVERAERVKVRAHDQNGNPFTLEAQGLLAVCIQHEMDHLKGKVFVEHLSQLKQQRIRAKLAKQGKRLPLLGNDDDTANRQYTRTFALGRDKTRGKAHGLEYAEYFHHIAPDDDGVNDYVTKNAVSL